MPVISSSPPTHPVPVHPSAFDDLRPGEEDSLRLPTLPPLYIYQTIHPLRPEDGKVGTSYVFFYDPSNVGKTRVLKNESTLHPPLGSSDPTKNNSKDRFHLHAIIVNQQHLHDLDLRGWQKLVPGDWVFARSIYSMGNAEEDVPKIIIPLMYVVASFFFYVLLLHNCSGDFLNAKKNDLENARDAILGDRNSRHDGTALFETTPYANKLGNARCYTMGSSLQHAKKIVGPAGAFKFDNSESQMDDTLTAVHNFIKVSRCM